MNTVQYADININRRFILENKEKIREARKMVEGWMCGIFREIYPSIHLYRREAVDPWKDFFRIGERISKKKSKIKTPGWEIVSEMRR
ncbi:MAG: hypothetical protein CVT89_03450 [Candidatus Altiarchaeales archaeon HGW-Altiarchaeales-2]|nr:MAG: hypothetical protein CVT89_03450 [Candidatus Altiarchaeales archaeon HGW-Altiarchaeales-2]